ncbi:MAG: hypothetical protein ACLQUY_06780 [Ktedonobacterales bacterium]
MTANGRWVKNWADPGSDSGMDTARVSGSPELPMPMSTPTRRSHGPRVGHSKDHLRLLLVTWSPSDPRMQKRLRLLSASLRSAGHSIIVCVPPDALSPRHAAEADNAGVEYIFVRQQRNAFTFALGSWSTLLRRFRPNVIHLCPDVPPRLALKLAASAQTRLHPPIPVLVETHSQVTHVMTDASKASVRHGESSLWTKLYRRPETQLVCPDPQTLWWYREMLQIPAYRLSLIGRRYTPAGEGGNGGRIGSSLLVANQPQTSKISASSDGATLLRLLVPLLAGRDSLPVIAYSNLRRHLQPLLANQSNEVPNSVTYVKCFADWLSCLGDARAVVGAIPSSDMWREIGAAQACDVPVVLVTDAEDSPEVQCADGIHLIHSDHFTQVVKALGLVEEDDGAAASVRDTEAEVECLFRIYQGVHLRECEP